MNLQDKATIDSSANEASASVSEAPRHLLTIAVEEYFHATALSRRIEHHHRCRLETRLERNVDRALEMLAPYNARATFFILGCITKSHPRLIQRIADAGHEIAARPWDHRPITSFDRDSFREDARKSKHALEQTIGKPVRGYRIAEQRFRLDDCWALRVLAEEGFTYDSSIYPRFQELLSQPWRRFPHRHEDDGLSIFEFPLSTWGPDGFLLPVAGGNIIRQLPAQLVRMAVADWTARYRSPFNMYFNVWELDPQLPRLAVVGFLRRMRLYRNLERMPELLGYFLERYQFQSLAATVPGLGAETQSTSVATGTRETPERPVPADWRAGRGTDIAGPSPSLEPFTVVIPCYNEEAVLSYLERTLAELVVRLAPRPVFFVFVDDGSSDGTVAMLRHLFGHRPDSTIVEHGRNRGVAAAIMTGISAADTELVGSMDCDCTYDPLLFAEMIELLDATTAAVTSSPYHPEGAVRNVPGWRLMLSRTLSRCYRVLLHNKLHTYTSCFRVYRRSAVVGLPLMSEGFLGMAEMIVALDHRGARIREFPAVLESRILGQSKMRTLRAIVEHLGLLRRLVTRRAFRLPPAARQASPAPPAECSLARSTRFEVGTDR